MKLTIGMACHRDFDGVYFTINALRLYHAEVLKRCELIVVDNDPRGPQASKLQSLLGNIHSGLQSSNGRHVHPYNVKYVSMEHGGGTTQPREEIFRQATGDAVLVLDCHVLLWPEAVQKLLAYYEQHPTTKDILSGPLVYDTYEGFADHFQNQWRDGMWGTWGTIWRSSSGQLVSTRQNPLGQVILCDPMSRQALENLDIPWSRHEVALEKLGYRMAIDSQEPFEIPAMGLGCFSALREHWPGFNKHFREFGGEEWYIHEKVRQRGGRALCLPFLKWQHRFGDPAGGRVHHFTTHGKVRNYILGLQELGLPLDRLRRHYVDGLNEDESQPQNRDNRLTPEQFDQLVQDPVSYPPFSRTASNKGCGTCRAPEPVYMHYNLDQLYARASQVRSDINEHCDKLRELASQAGTVVEFGHRPGVSTVALLAGQPRNLFSYITHLDDISQVLKRNAGETRFQLEVKDSLEVAIPPCDLLFIDTEHTEERLTRELEKHADRVRQRIVLHDTEVFGETGSDGKPGLLPALRQFLRISPEWSVIYHSQANHGLTVISRDPADKPKLPGMVKMASNFAKALAAHVMDGSDKCPPELFESRLQQCTLCDQRSSDRCAVCGCYIATKAEWSEQACPLGKW